MMWAVRIKHELYVYRNGILVYKKWIGTGRSVLLNNPRNYNTDPKKVIR